MPRLSDVQLQKRALMKTSLVKSVALKQTMQVANELRPHTIKVAAVAEKYVEYVSLVSDVLLGKYPDLARKPGDPDQVDPWPVNGLPFDTVYMSTLITTW
jgi:hypothetical protein